jgi:mitosis inhibitor protein kinase SWE1
MEWSRYSPHREAGGVLHLPSPTHAHSYHVEALQKLRRSLSRSPSKTSRFQLQTAKSPNTTPSTPSSPLARAAVSPAFGREYQQNPAPPSPLAAHTSTTSKGKKFALRRVGPLRASPRTNNSPRSPVRRALSDNSNQGNVTPSGSRRSSGDENVVSSTKESEAKTPLLRLDLNDGPIKFEFSRSKQENLAPADRNFLAKSSPLKRIDGRLNLDDSNFGSPAKRRSLHGAASFGPDFDVFSQDAMSSGRFEMAGSNDVEKDLNSFASSHPRRTSSLRKSTLQNRHPRIRQSEYQSDSSPQSTPAQKARNRVSMDCSLLMGPPMQSPFLRPQLSAQPSFTPRQAPRRQPSHPPHPLSNALTASSSGSSHTEDTYMETKPAAPKVLRSHVFTKSLPIGSSRPKIDTGSQVSSQSSFDTPTSYKSAKPNQRAFMSTGLISKKNRNIEAAADLAQYAMPDTPSKRYSYPPDTASPLLDNATKKPARPSLEFGTPNTPFASSGFFGKSNIFGAPAFGTNTSGRRRSFLSLEGEDTPPSPTANPDSQSSADELPPTPTKPAGKNGKESSLRSSLFGRRTSLGPDTFVPPSPAEIPASKKDVRISRFFSFTLEHDSEDEDESMTASPTPSKIVPRPKHAPPSPSPVALRTHSSLHLSPSPSYPPPPAMSAPLRQLRRMHMVLSQKHINQNSCTPGLPIDVPETSGRESPHTPHETFTPPDPSGLSISGKRDLGFSFFNSSTNSNSTFPPATPTAPRDYQFPFSNSTNAPVAAVTENDVDVCLSSRFGKVNVLGTGEFSKVFRVTDAVYRGTRGSPSQPLVFAVKKAKHVFTGQKDRDRKMKEVEILRSLRCNEHVVEYIDSWVDKGHLYIQTEYCENGNLFDFLKRVGNLGRLDDFRIWKILLELTLVCSISIYVPAAANRY